MQQTVATPSIGFSSGTRTEEESLDSLLVKFRQRYPGVQLELRRRHPGLSRFRVTELYEIGQEKIAQEDYLVRAKSFLKSL